MDFYNVINKIKNKYLNNNKEDVLRHVEDVADIAVGLADAYNLNVKQVQLAAFLHDISSIMTPQEMYELAKRRGLEIGPSEEKYHALLHQRISKIIAQEELDITDPYILNAVECHTTLRKNASICDKIIFIADKISRDSQCVPLHNELLRSGDIKLLDEACYSYIKHQFDNNLLAMPHQWILEAYEELKTNKE